MTDVEDGRSGGSDAERFGRLVRERREARGWKLHVLAEEAFSNADRKGYVSQIENGKIPNITRETVRTVARALGIDPEDIPASLRWPEAVQIENSTNSIAKRIEASSSESHDRISVMDQKIDRLIDNHTNNFLSIARRVIANTTAAAPIRFKRHVERFFHHYLGTGDVIVPFGGRSSQIEALNCWLTNPSAPPYMLLVGEAGRGKTALLVRWLCQISFVEHIIFLPISIRFDTNRPSLFFQAFASSLAAILKEEMERPSTDASDFYKEKVMEYIDSISDKNLKCLIVIDGLDEAVGWSIGENLFPLNPPRNLRIIISARTVSGDIGHTGWLRRLGWTISPSLATFLAVPPLDRAGIADLLHNTDAALIKLSEDSTVISELERLTGGDPLLLRYYADDLMENTEEVDSKNVTQRLREKSAGFGQYFDSWLEKQGGLVPGNRDDTEKRTIKAILAVLSVAQGPLLLRDLVAVIEMAHGEQGIIARDTIDAIRRFVIGDGVEIGYALGHPKLREYLKQEYFGRSSIVRRSEAGFIDWARKSISQLEYNRGYARSFSTYLLRFYSQHLEEAQSGTDIWRELTSNGWRRAWEVAGGGEGIWGIRNDVEATIRAFRRISTESAGDEAAAALSSAIRSAHIIATIDSLNRGVSNTLLHIALRRRRIAFGQALQFAERSSRLNSIFSYCALLPALSEAQRETVLEDSFAFASSLTNPRDLQCAVLKLAQHATPELLIELSSLASTLGSTEKASALIELARYGAAIPRSDIIASIKVVPAYDARCQSMCDAITYIPGIDPLQLSDAIMASLNGGHKSQALVALAERFGLDSFTNLIGDATESALSERAVDVRVPAILGVARLMNAEARERAHIALLFETDGIEWYFLEYIHAIVRDVNSEILTEFFINKILPSPKSVDFDRILDLHDEFAITSLLYKDYALNDTVESSIEDDELEIWASQFRNGLEIYCRILRYTLSADKSIRDKIIDISHNSIIRYIDNISSEFCVYAGRLIEDAIKRKIGNGAVKEIKELIKEYINQQQNNIEIYSTHAACIEDMGQSASRIDSYSDYERVMKVFSLGSRSERVRYAKMIIDYIDRTEDVSQENDLVDHCVDLLDDDILDEVIASAICIQDGEELVEALDALGPFMSDDNQIDALALSSGHACRSIGLRCLARLVPHLPEEIAKVAIEDALAEDHLSEVALVVSVDARRADPKEHEQRIKVVLSKATNLDKHEMMEVVGRLAKCIPNNLFEMVFPLFDPLVKSLGYFDYIVARTIEQISDYVPRADRARMAAYYKESILYRDRKEISLEQAKILLFGAQSSSIGSTDGGVAIWFFDEGGKRKALTDDTEEIWYFTEVEIKRHAEELGGNQLIIVLSSFSRRYYKLKYLLELSDHLKNSINTELRGELVNQLFIIVSDIIEKPGRYEDASGCLEEIATAMKKITRDEEIIQLYEILSKRSSLDSITGDAFKIVLAGVVEIAERLPNQKIEECSDRKTIEILSGLSSGKEYCLGDVLRGALADKSVDPDGQLRADLFRVVAPWLDFSLRAEAIEAVTEFSDPRARAFALVQLAGAVEENARGPLMARALDAVFECELSEQPALLAAAAPISRGEAALRIVTAARGFADVGDRIRVFAVVAHKLPEPNRTEAIGEAISSLARLPRPEVVRALTEFVTGKTPTPISLVGDQIISDFLDVARWWRHGR
ncbi:MAG: helix-turn-helix domain-containing protein [Pseudomonadota bacterium]